MLPAPGHPSRADGVVVGTLDRHVESSHAVSERDRFTGRDQGAAVEVKLLADVAQPGEPAEPAELRIPVDREPLDRDRPSSPAKLVSPSFA